MRLLFYILILISLFIITPQVLAQYDGGYGGTDGGYGFTDGSYVGTDGAYCGGSIGGCGSDGGYGGPDGGYGGVDGGYVSGNWISANPVPCQIPAGRSTCNNVQIFWSYPTCDLNVPGRAVGISTQGGGPGYWFYSGGNKTGNQGANFVGTSPITFQLKCPDSGSDAAPVAQVTAWGIPPPVTFTQNLPVASCVGGTAPQIRVSWAAATGAANYEVFFLDSLIGALTDKNIITAGTTYDFTTTDGYLIPGHQYGFVIVALDSIGNTIAWSDGGQWSHAKFGSFTTYPNNCRSGPPQIELALNSQRFPLFPLNVTPLSVKLNFPVSLRWVVTEADSCTRSNSTSISPNPHNAYWLGALSINPNLLTNSGTVPTISTAEAGTSDFTLSCTNVLGSSVPVTAYLKVTNPLPFIKTTGGDVHTNEIIDIPN